MLQHALLMRAVVVDTTNMQLSGPVRPADHSWLSNQLSPQGDNGTGMKRLERVVYLLHWLRMYSKREQSLDLQPNAESASLPTAIGLLDSIGVVSLSSFLCSIALLAGIGLINRTDDVSMSRCHCSIAPVAGIGLINSTDEVSMSKCHCSLALLSGIGLINGTRRQHVEMTVDVSTTRCHCSTSLLADIGLINSTDDYIKKKEKRRERKGLNIPENRLGSRYEKMNPGVSLHKHKSWHEYYNMSHQHRRKWDTIKKINYLST
ncbi:hypothetical protein J6590_041258 [Homalodisca vitripennis]|nr:hypothetical protein J6590_041258 [Homalodisca vitripennis]